MTRARDLAAGTFELATGGVLKLETSDTTVTDGSVLGKIEFKAPDEASGTDAILVGAAIEAVAEGTFAADNNATELVFKTGASAAADAKMTLDSSGNVGIGATPPTTSGYTNLTLGASTTGSQIRLYGATSGFFHRIINNNGDLSIQADADNVKASTNLTFSVDGSEAMRIDSSGNLLVGKTASGSANVGGEIRPSGSILATSDGGFAAVFNRETSDGEIIRIRKDNSTVGSINITNSASVVSLTGESSGGGIAMGKSAANVYPARPAGVIDNTLDFGSSSYRWDDIYATNGTIQTSDRNEKQDIASLTSAEMLVAKRISALFKTFRWKEKVAEKGDNARTHTGIIAQDVQAAFTAEGLDAGDYSLFISTTWWEHDVDVPAVEAVAEVTETTTDEDGNNVVTVTTEAVEAKDAYTRTDTYDTQSEAPAGATSKTRMGIRYPELLSFVAAYNEQRFASIETRLTALEG